MTDLRVINCKLKDTGELHVAISHCVRRKFVKVEKRLLRDNKLTLDSTLSAFRASEEYMIHLKELHSKEMTAAAVFKKPQAKPTSRGNWSDRKKSGQSYLHTRTQTSHVEDAEDLMKKKNVQHLANFDIGVTDRITTSNSVRQRM